MTMVGSVRLNDSLFADDNGPCLPDGGDAGCRTVDISIVPVVDVVGEDGWAKAKLSIW